MDPFVFVAVLLAAVLHATWNALTKSGGDKETSMAAVVLGHVPLALVGLSIAPLPDPAALPWIAAGVALHCGYQFFLLNSYRVGDLTQVYPIARGVAPLVVALVSVGALGVALTGMETLAILVIACGILSLGLTRSGDGLRNPAATALALGTGLFIAGYSLVDGTGARVAGTSLGYYSWQAIGNAVAFSVILRVTKPGTLRNIPRVARGTFLVGGSASFAAYAIVTWAFTQAPIPLVTALRETSIVFALLIGVLVLKEPLNLRKVASTFLTVCGAALLRVAR